MARPLPPLDPEFALVAACAVLDEPRVNELAPVLLARPGFDWQRAARLAFYHEVEQLLRLRLGDAVPPEPAADIRHALVQTAALQAAQATTAVRVTGALAEARIPSLLIKGVALAQQLYAPMPWLRASNDVDILVAPEDLRDADRVLQGAGLARSWPEAEPPEAAEAMLLQLANVFTYNGPVLGEMVELHCRATTNPFWLPVSFAELHAAGAEVDVGPGRVRTIDGPLSTFYLCQHALYNQIDFRLKWFADIARAVNRAGARDCASHVAGYPGPLPPGPGRLADQVLATLRAGIEQAAGGGAAGGTGADAARIVRRMVRAEGIPVGRSLARLPEELAYHSLVLRHLPGWRGKMRQLLIALSDPRDAITLRLSPRFTFVYWLAGPVLSLSRFVRRGRGIEETDVEAARQ